MFSGLNLYIRTSVLFLILVFYSRFCIYFLCSIYLKPLQLLIFIFCYIMPFVDYRKYWKLISLNSYCHKLESQWNKSGSWICLNLILYTSSTNSITFCDRRVFGYVSLGGCQAKSSQTDRHRIKSYTFFIFQTSKLY
jgi:hypothetical protein